MCAQCVAAGSAYVVPAVVGLKVWSSRRTRQRRPAPASTAPVVAPVVEPADEPAPARA